jgi:hypothetical protein
MDGFHAVFKHAREHHLDVLLNFRDDIGGAYALLD